MLCVWNFNIKHACWTYFVRRSNALDCKYFLCRRRIFAFNLASIFIIGRLFIGSGIVGVLDAGLLSFNCSILACFFDVRMTVSAGFGLCCSVNYAARHDAMITISFCFDDLALIPLYAVMCAALTEAMWLVIWFVPDCAAPCLSCERERDTSLSYSAFAYFKQMLHLVIAFLWQLHLVYATRVQYGVSVLQAGSRVALHVCACRHVPYSSVSLLTSFTGRSTKNIRQHRRRNLLTMCSLCVIRCRL